MTRLFLVAGMPGAGKTTRARSLVAAHGGVLLCPDEWFAALGLDPHDAPLRRRMEKHLWAQGRELLARGVDVVVDFGSWARLERERLRKAARELGADVELHALDVPLEERWRRLAVRNAEPGAVRISRAQLQDWETYWQPVTDAELAAWDAPLADGPTPAAGR